MENKRFTVGGSLAGIPSYFVMECQVRERDRGSLRVASWAGFLRRQSLEGGLGRNNVNTAAAAAVARPPAVHGPLHDRIGEGGEAHCKKETTNAQHS